MATLSNLISSKARAEIFRILFGISERELHIREIERQSGLSFRAVHQELKHLKNLDLIKERRSSNRVYCRANDEHPLFNDIRNIVLKTSGLVDVLRGCLDHEEVKVAFVFGSVARKEEGAGSDVDLMVIGDVSLRKVSEWLMGSSEKIGREINPHTLSLEEYRERKQQNEHFVSGVLDSPKLFIIGDEDELAALDRQQVAPFSPDVG